MSLTTATIYAQNINVSPSGRDEVAVFLYDIDPAQVISEIGALQLLEYMDFEDVHGFVIEKLKEIEEEQREN